MAVSKKRRVSFRLWQKKAANYAQRHLGMGDLFDDFDPYDLKENHDPHTAYVNGRTPASYVRMVFEEDFARQAHDWELARGG